MSSHQKEGQKKKFSRRFYEKMSAKSGYKFMSAMGAGKMKLSGVVNLSVIEVLMARWRVN